MEKGLFYVFIFLLSFFAFGEKIDKKYYPYVGNGRIAMKLSSDSIFIQGFFNGPVPPLKKPSTHASHRAKIPNFLEEIQYDESVDLNEVTFNFSTGVFTRRLSTSSSGENENIFENTYAHRKYSNLLVLEISASRPLQEEICFDVFNSTGSDDVNITVVEVENGYVYLQAETYINETESTGIQRVFIGKPNDTHFCSKFESTFFFLLVFADLYEDCKKEVEKYNGKKDELMKVNEMEWGKIWEHGIEIDGNATLNRIVKAAFYYILASLREDGNYSTSPATLSSNDYSGHVFWDNDFFVFPAILPFFSDFARATINYRLKRRGGAQKKAEMLGYDGEMWPWESAVSGLEVCPWPPCSLYEQHIVGDVVFAFQLYNYMCEQTTSDLRQFYGVAKAVADFWVSRVSKIQNSTLYGIDLVIGPDEYHAWINPGVNNSVFINALAQKNLEFAIYLAKIVGETPKPNWDLVAKNLYFPTDGKIDLEFDTYAGQMIQQADVVLTHYPLSWKPAKMKENLVYYQERLDPKGPCMSNGIHSVQWIELNDKEQGFEFFQRSFKDNSIPPFYVWSERKGGDGAINFITGSAVFLQSITNGYAGLRILQEKIRFKPEQIPFTSGMNLKGIGYKGLEFDLFVRSNETTLNANKGNLLVEIGGKTSILKEGERKVIQGEFFIQRPSIISQFMDGKGN